MLVSGISGGISLGFVPQPPRTSAPTVTFLMDVPLLRDVDSNPGGSGYYFALTSGMADWAGAVLFRSINDAAFDEEGSNSVPVSFGYALDNALAEPPSPWTWDEENELTITMVRGALSGVSELSVLNGANTLLVGDEVIQFQNAVQNMDGSYTISRLLRGRRGTEWACGAHVEGETVLVLAGSAGAASGVSRKPHALSILNQLGYYRGITIGQDLTSSASQQFTIIGRDLKPYAPAQIAGTRDGSDNLTIDWVRRTRIGGDWQDLIGDVPISEESELYDVEIMDGVDVVRTFSGLTSPTVDYSAAEQTADGLTPGDPMAVKIYQRSAQVGRGFVAEATV